MFARPLYMQPAAGDAAIAYTAQDDRAGLLSSVFSREGVLDVDAGQLKVTQRAAGANLSVDIAPGRAAVFGDDVSDQGTYLINNTTAYNLSTFSTGSAITAPGSGSRTHRLIARVRDKLHNGSWTTYDWLPQLLQDSGSGTPAEPASAITLALITISAGQSSITNAAINDQRPRASVGTVDRAGTFTLEGGYGGSDGSRLCRWRRNPDGWVSLSGWRRRSGGTFTAQLHQQIELTDSGGLYGPVITLPPEMRPVSPRDVLAATSDGPVHLLFTPDGKVFFRYVVPGGIQVTQDVWWISFDGVMYLAT